MKCHYTYRITNKILNKHYYGTRTSTRLPKEDIGIYYFSSSSDKEFIQDQKDNPQNYKYKVIKTFNSRKEAINLEIKLHSKFNVAVNEQFYNRAKQTSLGFDTTGTTRTEESKKNQIKAVKGKKQSKEHIEKRMSAHVGSKRSNKTKLKMSKIHKGKKLSEEHKSILSEISKNQKHSLERREKQSEIMKGENNPMFGKTHSDENKTKMSHKGETNGSTYIIEIFNSDGLVEEINSYNFLRHSYYPINALRKSIKLGKIISKNGDGVRVLKDKDIWEGWYAIRKK